jgi:hypothetical protein
VIRRQSLRSNGSHYEELHEMPIGTEGETKQQSKQIYGIQELTLRENNFEVQRSPIAQYYNQVAQQPTDPSI